MDEVKRAKTARTLRFLVSGGTSVGVYYLVLYLLTEKAKVWYLASSLAAFVLYWITNFSLHKYWTFGNQEKSAVPAQAGKHLAMTFGFLIANTFGLYMLVERLGLWYMAAQVMLSAVLSTVSYLLMGRIFKTNSN